MHELDVGAATALMQRHPQRVQDERGARVPGDLPADHAPAVGVEDEGEVHHAFPAPEVGETGDPELVPSGGAEVTIDKVRPAPHHSVRSGRAPCLPPRLAPQIPLLRINRSTPPRPVASPAGRSAFHIRRDP
jgi:hypothetical protein